MLTSFRYAGIITAIFAVCGPATAQELAPSGSGVSIHKMVIDNGSAKTVKYYVTGGSPKLQALVRRVEWTENELGVIEQLQGLKLDIVTSERRMVAARAAQLTAPYVPPGFVSPSMGTYGGGDDRGSLQKALNYQLAYEATPQMALQMIGYLEQVQTEFDAELKALPPQELKAAKGLIDDLRPRLAALPGSAVPTSAPQPSVPQPILGPSPVNPQQMRTTGPAAATPIGFPAQAITQQPQNSVALQQTVLQNQEQLRQQIMQMQQQIAALRK